MQTNRLKRMIALLLAAAFFTLCLGCSKEERGASGGVVINEVVSSNKRSLVDEAVGSPDWLELYNPTDQAISLEGMGLSDNIRNLHKYLFPAITIEPHGYLVVYAGDNNGVTKTDVPCTGFGLSKSGDYLFLTDAYYGVLQQLEVPALYTDVSYARRDDGAYGYCAAPTPGAANTEAIEASLDALFSERDLSALVISEVMPTDAADGNPWVELHNTGASALSLDNYYLSDSEANLMRWQMPAVAIPAGGYACIWLSGEGSGGTSGVHSTFRLGKQDTCLLLSDLQGVLLDEIRWEAGLPEGVSVVKTGEGGAYTAFPTYEKENSADTFTELGLQPMSASDPVHISEVLVENTLSAVDGDGDRAEWVELVNRSGAPVSLKGYFLSDDEAELFKWALPDVTLEAGGYVLVFLSGKNRTEGELHASFSLNAEETAVYLTTQDGMRTEQIPIEGLSERENISVGVDADGNLRYYAQPTPGSANAQGFETADSIGFFNKEGVFISETGAVPAPKSGDNDWIELYNGSSEPVDLSGWYLSDSPSNPKKWQIPSLVIGAGDYAVIEASSHPTRQTEGVAPFGISNGGETLVLSDAAGNRVDSFATGALSAGLTSGRVVSDETIARAFFTEATPGASNDDEFSVGYAPEPAFSEAGLYHTEPFTVTITCRDPNAVVRYTLDGADPTQRSKQYDGPIEISGNTVLRAASFVPGKVASNVTSANYLFEEPHTVPVVCVFGNPDEVREVMKVNDKDEKVERKAYISYYETDGTLGVTFPAGIKPKGAGTVAYAQKSLSLNLRAGYGQSSVTYPFFPESAFRTFSALVVRNGGQDWSHARMRDSFCARMVQGMHLDYSQTRSVAMYVNGAYNGLYDLNEDQNSEYLVTHYGVDGDAVDVIRRNSTTIAGDNKDIKRVRQYAWDTDLSDDEKFAEFSQWIDVEQFTDYFIAQTYFCNSDMFNQKYWRSQDYVVKWRPIFYDLDFGCQSATRDMIGQYFNETGVPSADGSLTYFEIYIGLKKNAAWRDYCVERYVECVVKYFNAERAGRIFDEMYAVIQNEMPRQIARWKKPRTMKAWEEEAAELREIAVTRPEYALENMRRYFGVSKARLNELIEKYAAEASTEPA